MGGGVTEKFDFTMTSMMSRHMWMTPYVSLKTEIAHFGLGNLVKNTVALHRFTFT
jgi:hypothetical protein